MRHALHIAVSAKQLPALRAVVVGLLGFVVWNLTAPGSTDAAGCQIGFTVGTTIADGAIDGTRGAEWNDANIIQSGFPCMDPLLDWNGTLPPAGAHVAPSLNKTVKAFSKRDTNHLYLAFEVLDQTQNRQDPGHVGEQLPLGEKIILQIDPNHSGGTGLEPGGADYRIEVTHTWAAATMSRKFYTSSVPPASSVCNRPDWGEQPLPATLRVALGTALPGGYVVEFKIPLSLIGNPTTDIGIAFAVVNDLGFCVGTSCDATGLAFPTTLPMNNVMSALVSDPLNPTGCGDWLTPANWGLGYFAVPLADVSISRNPVWWNSEDIQALACAAPGYTYYPDNPCRLELQATLHNSGSAAQVRNLLYLWADHGASPSTWRVIALQDGVTVPTTGGIFLSGEWNMVPKGLAHHPCVRVYILPPVYEAAFDRNAILAIDTPTELDQMVMVYGLGTQHWAQKNISMHSTVRTCPNQECRIASLPFRPREFSIVPVAYAQQERPNTGAQPVMIDKRERVLLSDGELRTYGTKNVILQGRAFGYSSQQTTQTPHYHFIEELGGVLQIFPVEMIKQNKEIPFQMQVTNPGKIARTIFIKVDAHIPPEIQDVQIAVDTKPQDFKPGETRTFRGTVTDKTNSKQGTRCGRIFRTAGLLLGSGAFALFLFVRRRWSWKS
jgi:hypothetical protein